MGDMDGTPPSSIGLAAINSTLNIKKAQYLFLNVWGDLLSNPLNPPRVGGIRGLT